MNWIWFLGPPGAAPAWQRGRAGYLDLASASKGGPDPGFRPGWAVPPVRGQAEPLKTAKDRYRGACAHAHVQHEHDMCMYMCTVR